MRAAREVPQHLWYGHYNPSREIMPARKSDLERVRGLMVEPIQTRRQAREFMDSFARAVPKYRAVVQELESEGTDVFVVKEDFPRVTQLPDDERALFFPKGLAPYECFPQFISASGGLLNLPDGVQLPSVPQFGKHEHILSRLRDRLNWSQALMDTFLYQIVHEMAQAGLLDPAKGTRGILEASNIALFRIMREEGLPGMVRRYANFFESDPRYQFFSHLIERRAEEIFIQGGMVLRDVPLWLTPKLHARPSLRRTLLDDLADRQKKFGSGLYVKNEVEGIGEAEQNELLKSLEGEIKNNRDVAVILHVISKLAPKLAELLFARMRTMQMPSPMLRKRIGSVIVQADMDIHDILNPNPNSFISICIRPGASKADVLFHLVGALGIHLMPLDYLRFGSIEGWPRTEAGSQLLQQILVKQMCKIQTFSLTALLEFMHQAHQSNIAFEFNGVEIKRFKRAIEENGIEVVSDHFEEYADPELIQQMKSEAKILADEYLSGKS